jgi:hypothetical protein
MHEPAEHHADRDGERIDFHRITPRSFPRKRESRE